MRWDFGFTCAFCLTHEADLFATGAEGTGLMSIEHITPQNPLTGVPALANSYDNCALACRFCNGARGTKRIVDGEGRSLLDPCDRSWSDHFHIVDGEMRVRDSKDGDAQYTWEAYDLSDSRKTQLRWLRRQLIESRLEMIESYPEVILKIEQLLSAAEIAHKKDPGKARTILALAMELHSSPEAAIADLERFSAIPSDCPTTCRCHSTSEHSLPAQLEAQTIPMPSV